MELHNTSLCMHSISRYGIPYNKNTKRNYCHSFLWGPSDDRCPGVTIVASCISRNAYFYRFLSPMVKIGKTTIECFTEEEKMICT